MRGFSTTVVAEALDIDRRRLDNLVAQHAIEGVRRERQGVSRTFSPAAVLTIAVAVELMERLEMAASRALAVARSVVGSGGDHSPTDGITVRIDVRIIEQRIAGRLTDAVEAHPPPRRGRPPAPRR